MCCHHKHLWGVIPFVFGGHTQFGSELYSGLCILDHSWWDLGDHEMLRMEARLVVCKARALLAVLSPAASFL